MIFSACGARDESVTDEGGSRYDEAASCETSNTLVHLVELNARE